jgi:hypothetical protein
MKTKAISSIFVLFAIAAGMASMAPAAFAHPHDEISIIAFDESTISSYIADMEHENPMFKEAVKLVTAPMLSSLTLMENAESESEVLGLGLSVIALNLGMYIAAPALIAMKVNQQIKSRK